MFLQCIETFLFIGLGFLKKKKPPWPIFVFENTLFFGPPCILSMSVVMISDLWISIQLRLRIRLSRLFPLQRYSMCWTTWCSGSRWNNPVHRWGHLLVIELIYRVDQKNSKNYRSDANQKPSFLQSVQLLHTNTPTHQHTNTLTHQYTDNFQVWSLTTYLLTH